MIDSFWLITALPLLIPFAAKLIWKSSISFLEMGVQVALAGIVAICIWNVGKYQQMSDTELWNGEVIAKAPHKEDCPWGWTRFKDGFCRHYRTRQVKTGETCTTDNKGRRSCTPTYTTEYNYDFPWEQNWYVNTNIGRWEIARADRQGATMPQRWDIVYIGDPVTKPNDYINYVKAASSSLFNKDARYAEKFIDIIPEYPLNIYDYYHVDRVLPVGVEIADLRQWNDDLADVLKKLGPEKQANVVVILNDQTLAFANGTIAAWQGGKKNDILVFIGTDGTNIEWAHIHSWSKNDLFNIQLRDRIRELPALDREAVMAAISEVAMKQFERRPMAEFEYLEDEIEPSANFLIFAFIFTLILSCGVTFLMHRIDLDDIVKQLLTRLRR